MILQQSNYLAALSHTMEAQGAGILGFFVLAFIIMLVGVGVEQNGIDPIGFYQLSGLLGVCGVFLLLRKSGVLGSFGIKW